MLELRSSTDMCPVVSKARLLAARLDSKLFYYYKADLARYCNMEDSFYKFYLDGWVRGIVTASDEPRHAIRVESGHACCLVIQNWHTCCRIRSLL